MSKMINCKSCGAEIASSAKTCPSCGAKNKKPVYKRVWFIALIIIVVAAVIGSVGGSDEPTADTPDNGAGNTEAKQEITYTAYDVDQLVNDLDDNAMRAEETYQDQYVELTGKLSVIDSDGSYISIEPLYEEFSFTSVTCNFTDEEQKDVAMNLSVGDTIVVKGQITDVGEIMGYSIDIDSISAK